MLTYKVIDIITLLIFTGGVVMGALAAAGFPLEIWGYPLLEGDRNKILPILTMTIGFFGFMINDRVQVSAMINNQNLLIKDVAQPLNQWKDHAAILRDQRVLAKNMTILISMSAPDCLSYTFNRMKTADQMYNTSFTDYQSLTNSRYHEWLDTIVTGVSEQGCIVHEVMSSESRLNSLRERFKSYNKAPLGTYQAHVLSTKFSEMPPFIEFCIFEGGNEPDEVIFGWTKSDGFFLGQTCFIVRDKDAIEYFKSYFSRIAKLAPPSFIQQH